MQVFKIRAIELPSQLKNKKALALSWFVVILASQFHQIFFQTAIYFSLAYSFGFFAQYMPSLHGRGQLEVSDQYLKYRTGTVLVWQQDIQQVDQLRREKLPLDRHSIADPNVAETNKIQPENKYQKLLAMANNLNQGLEAPMIFVYCEGVAEYSLQDHNFNDLDLKEINQAIKQQQQS